MQTAEPSTVKVEEHNARRRSQAPVFVLGSPRSGTTLLYHMLVSAGNFANYRAESQAFNLLEPRFGDLSVEGNRRRLLAAWRKSRLFTATGLKGEEIERECAGGCRNAGDFLRIVMTAMARQQGVERWADCTPEHLLYVQRIKQTIPDALVIHIIRDGRDVALSMARQGWIRPFPWQRGDALLASALYWEWIVEKGMKAGKQLGADYLEVRFEELVTRPREALETVGAFIGQELDYDRIQASGVGSVSSPNTSFDEQNGDQDFAPVERWKKAMPREQLSRVQAAIGGCLRELGYEDDPSLPESDRSSVMRMRRHYRAHFDLKFWIKARTPVARWLVTKDLSWV